MSRLCKASFHTGKPPGSRGQARLAGPGGREALVARVLIDANQLTVLLSRRCRGIRPESKRQRARAGFRRRRQPGNDNLRSGQHAAQFGP
jgi:hypothetical protein